MQTEIKAGLTPQELTIGSWVIDTLQGDEPTMVKIEGISNSDKELLNEYYIEYKGCKTVIDDFIQGIELTPDILEKAGFERRYGNTYFKGKLKFTYEHNELSKFVRFHWSGKVTYLQYLHQLQNLYFSLCGTELTVNF